MKRHTLEGRDALMKHPAELRFRTASNNRAAWKEANWYEKGALCITMRNNALWTIELHCSIPSLLSAEARAFVLFAMRVGEAMDRSVGGVVDGGDGAAFTGDVLEALPPEMWLHILSFLRLAELRFAVAPPGGKDGASLAPVPLDCDVCDHTFNTPPGVARHMSSKKHAKVVAAKEAEAAGNKVLAAAEDHNAVESGAEEKKATKIGGGGDGDGAAAMLAKVRDQGFSVRTSKSLKQSYPGFDIETAVGTLLALKKEYTAATGNAMLECKHCGDPFHYDKHGSFGAGAECLPYSPNVNNPGKGTKVRRWHTKGWHDYWGHECCGAKDSSDPNYLGCESRTVQQNGPHEPVDTFWTIELHCSIPSLLSAEARAFVLFAMRVGEAMDRSEAVDVDVCVGLSIGLSGHSKDVLEALPPDVWMHILSFMWLSELRFATPPRGFLRSIHDLIF